MTKFFYKKDGIGKKILILFHGFGQDHSVFNNLSETCKSSFTLYSFDIYYHGNSHRPDTPLTRKQWQEDFIHFLRSEDIQKFSVLGFSLGGRFAIATSMLFPDRTEAVFLIAPDGVFQSIWYRLAHTYIGNRLFRYLMKRPGLFFYYTDLFERNKLISPSLGRFVRHELASADNRKKVYRTWTYFRPLQYSPVRIAKVFDHNRIPLHLILGEKDRIIPVGKVKPRLRNIRTLTCHLVPCRHHQMIEAAGPVIRSVM